MPNRILDQSSRDVNFLCFFSFFSPLTWPLYGRDINIITSSVETEPDLKRAERYRVYVGIIYSV